MFEALVVWGLRPHELYEIDMEKMRKEQDGIITVRSKKTKKERVVSALYSEWFFRWKLWEGMPPPTNRKRKKGATITYYFDKLNLGIQPYDLRHTWAVRALYWPYIDEAQAARQMGHSLSIHQRVYEFWIDEHRARMEQTKRLNKDWKPEIPDDPPDKASYETKEIHTVPGKFYQHYAKVPCKHCGSQNVIWAGWTSTSGRLYGRKQYCKTCDRVQTVKPSSLEHSETL
jgi:hypothetical protein